MAASPQRAPSPLVVVHKSFIVTAIACMLVTAAWELREFLRGGAGADAVWAVLATAAAAGLAVYFRSLRHLSTKLTAPDDARRDA